VEVFGLSSSGKTAIAEGSPEFLVLSKVISEGSPLSQLKPEPGFSEAMKNKWIILDKSGSSPIVKLGVRLLPFFYYFSFFYPPPTLLLLFSFQNVPAADATKAQLEKVMNGEDINQKELMILQKRKLIAKRYIAVRCFSFIDSLLFPPSSYVYYTIEKAENFEKREKPETELTEEMLRTYHLFGVALFILPPSSRGSWETKFFKPLNPNALGAAPPSGYRHPLSKIRNEFRQIFLEMGYAVVVVAFFFILPLLSSPYIVFLLQL
jgi:hypothetical protein